MAERDVTLRVKIEVPKSTVPPVDTADIDKSLDNVAAKAEETADAFDENFDDLLMLLSDDVVQALNDVDDATTDLLYDLPSDVAKVAAGIAGMSLALNTNAAIWARIGGAAAATMGIFRGIASIRKNLLAVQTALNSAHTAAMALQTARNAGIAIETQLTWALAVARKAAAAAIKFLSLGVLVAIAAVLTTIYVVYQKIASTNAENEEAARKHLEYLKEEVQHSQTLLAIELDRRVAKAQSPEQLNEIEDFVGSQINLALEEQIAAKEILISIDRRRMALLREEAERVRESHQVQKEILQTKKQGLDLKLREVEAELNLGRSIAERVGQLSKAEELRVVELAKKLSSGGGTAEESAQMESIVGRNALSTAFKIDKGLGAIGQNKDLFQKLLPGAQDQAGLQALALSVTDTKTDITKTNDQLKDLSDAMKDHQKELIKTLKKMSDELIDANAELDALNEDRRHRDQAPKDED